MQEYVRAEGLKVVVIFEGRDGAGKGGVIKRIAERTNPRVCRVVALPKPTERDVTSWYFQRFVPHLPAGQETVLFNRSWYNRAGVERVMGFCSREELRDFFDNVIPFETMLIDSGIRLFKYYLDIDRKTQAERLAARREDPLKQWKLSPIDAKALAKWDDYTAARDEMLAKTSVAVSPWYVVKADDKKVARLNVIRHLLAHIDYHDKDGAVVTFDERVVHAFTDKDAAKELAP